LYNYFTFSDHISRVLGGRGELRTVRAGRAGRSRIRSPPGRRRPLIIRSPISPLTRHYAYGRSASRRRSPRVRPSGRIHPPGRRPPSSRRPPCCRPPCLARPQRCALLTAAVQTVHSIDNLFVYTRRPQTHQRSALYTSGENVLFILEKT
jgi:hypothetical protein